MGNQRPGCKNLANKARIIGEEVKIAAIFHSREPLFTNIIATQIVNATTGSRIMAVTKPFEWISKGPNKAL